MAMNFGNFNNYGASAAADNTGGVLNLNKGGVLDLTKVAPSLDRVMLGAGWDVNTSGGYDFDLDISAFLLNKQGKIDTRNPLASVVFFNNMSVQGVTLSGDNRTGSGEGDDEQIVIELSQIPQDVESILINVNIYDAMKYKQTFGQVKNSYVRLVDLDNNEKELCRFELRENAGTATAVVFVKLFRNNHNGWSFEALGEPYMVNDLNQLLQKFM